MNTPLITIIMPTYKQSVLMHKAVKSVLNQTYENIELIVIDDNKDESYKHSNLEFFNSLNCEKIKYVQNEINLGSAGSRNHGLKLAKGEYVTFLDDDDYYDSLKIEKQIIGMIEKEADVSVCNLILTNENGKVVDARRRKYLKRYEDLVTAHIKYHITGTDTMMFKTELLRSVGGFDAQDLGDEFFLMLKVLETKPKFVHIDYDGAYALVHSQSGLSSGDNKIKAEQGLMLFLEKYFDKLKKSDVNYIKMRHNVVLAIAHKKNKSYLKCFGCLIRASFLHLFGMFKILSGADR